MTQRKAPSDLMVWISEKLSLRQLRRSVAVVLQDVFLFSDTIEENIKMGNRSTMQMDEIKSAAASAQASSL